MKYPHALRVCGYSSFNTYFVFKFHQPRILINTPAATAEPITPETFGPIACISRKLPGFSSWPTFWLTRAAIGTAETPAEPINGFTLPFVAINISLPNNTPPAVPKQKANRPRIIMPMVCGLRKTSPLAVALYGS